jgi:hypothetical protein
LSDKIAPSVRSGIGAMPDLGCGFSATPFGARPEED